MQRNYFSLAAGILTATAIASGGALAQSSGAKQQEKRERGETRENNARYLLTVDIDRRNTIRADPVRSAVT